MVPPVYGYVQDVTGTHDCFVPRNIFELWKSIVIRSIEIDLQTDRVKQSDNAGKSVYYHALSIVGMVHGVRVQTLELAGRKQDAPLVAVDLCEKILLFVVMARRDVTFHRYQQQVVGQRSPRVLRLLPVAIVPVELKEVLHDVGADGAVQTLLQVQAGILKSISWRNNTFEGLMAE